MVYGPLDQPDSYANNNSLEVLSFSGWSCHHTNLYNCFQLSYYTECLLITSHVFSQLEGKEPKDTSAKNEGSEENKLDADTLAKVTMATF